MTSDILSAFQALLEYTLVFTAQLLCIMLVRKPVRRWLGAINAYRLWLLPVLWLPVYLLDWSAVSLQGLLSLLPRGVLTPHVDGSLVSTGFAFLDVDLPLPSLPGLSLAQSSTPAAWLLLSALWLAGMLVLLVREGLSMVHFARFVQRQGKRVPAPEADNVRAQSAFSAAAPVCFLRGLESPALYGLFRPTLLLPESFLDQYDADQRHVILSHEAIHLQRRDNVWNLLAYLANMVFWFNPVAHLAHRFYRLDQELSCDAEALKQCNPQQSRRYAGTLVESIDQARTLGHPPIIAAWENPRELKERILMVNQHLTLKSRRLTAVVSLFMVTVLGGTLTACMSNNVAPPVQAGAETAGRPLPARPDDVVSRRVYDRINKVIELRDAGNFDDAMAILDELKAMDDQGRLNNQEQLVLWQFIAGLNQIQERYSEADADFAKILANPNLSVDGREQILKLRASLHFAMEDFDGAIDYLEQYNQVARQPDADVYYRLGAAHYQLEEYADALPFIQKSIGLLEDSSQDIPRSRYALLRALYIETGDPDSADTVLRNMVARYDEAEDKTLLSAAQRNDRAAATGTDKVFAEVVTNDNDVVFKQAKKEMLPIVVIQPRYPQEAIDKKIEGWALVGFTVTETGDVSNPRVIDAEPEAIFDDVSLTAVSKFRFNPRMEDGRAVPADGIRYLFRYSLQ